MSGSNSLYLGYDGTERRVYKKETVNSVNQEQIYLHDGMHAIIERQKSGQTTEYIMGPTGIIAVRTNGAECYIIKDHLGSTRVVVDKTGTVQSGYEYSSFGTLISSTGTNGINYRFTGQEYDGLTGLHNFKARMYDEQSGRFYGVDPAEELVYSYGYASNNPLSYRDPDGKFIQFVIMGAMMGGVMGAMQADMQGKSWLKGATFGAISGAAGGAVGGAIGPVNGLIQNVAVGALSGGVSSGLNATLNRKNIGEGIKSGAISGGIVSGALYTLNFIGGTSSRFQSNEGGDLKVDMSKNTTEGYEDYINSTMKSMEENGGYQGKVQVNKIKTAGVKVMVNNHLASYGGTGYKSNSAWDYVKDFIYGGGNGTHYILLNHNRLSNPPSNHGQMWKSLKLDGPEGLIGRSVQTLYHESGHLFGLYEFNINKSGYKWVSPKTLGGDHWLPHQPWETKIGEMTFDWLENVYMQNYITK